MRYVRIGLAFPFYLLALAIIGIGGVIYIVAEWINISEQNISETGNILDRKR